MSKIVKRLLLAILLFGLFIGIFALEFWGFKYHSKETTAIFAFFIGMCLMGFCFFIAVKSITHPTKRSY